MHLSSQTRVHEMVAILLSGGEGKEGVWEQLSPEDATAVDALMTRGGRKRTKRKKTHSEI